MADTNTRDDVHLIAAKRLRSVGLRYSNSRRAVVDVLYDTERPLTIPEILERDGKLSQSSVYRNLSELASSSVVHRIVAGDNYSHFELDQDLTSHHHHLVCTNCGRVEDFSTPAHLEEELDKALQKVARKSKFSVQRHRLDLLGTCEACSA